MNGTLYKYETHCHTAPVSQCAAASVKETVRFYKEIGYDGIFITNHFLDGNINRNVREMPYAQQVEFYFSDYEEGLIEGEKAGLKVFPGVELSYGGTDFLVYGPEKDWYLAHPEIMDMKKTEELKLLADEGAFIVQAHPFREAGYIDHIRLFPRSVHAVEVVNSNRPEPVNRMADIYAEHYDLLRICGSDNHLAGGLFADLEGKGLSPEIAGMCSEQPLNCTGDFIRMFLSGGMRMFAQTASGGFRLLD